ncbi:MAG: DUF4234 domain-containing protein [Clostridia bacterium]|nr:DUF4234 domain-containing protein [Clostridia bacterium]
MERFKVNRGIIGYIFLSIITFSIYPMYYIHRVAVELNTTCEIDGKHTRGFWGYFFLSLITLGIYGIVWQISTASRMGSFLKENGYNPNVTGTSYFLWCTVGCLLFGLGPLIAMTKFIHAHNYVNVIHNQSLNVTKTA